MTKQKIIDNPSEWIITKRGDFVRIKDSEILTEKKLEAIRKHLKKPYKGVVRFQGKTPEQVSKERYDKVLEEVNFDYEKLHHWIYDEKNKDKIEIVKLEEQDYQEAVAAIIKHVKGSQQKWRIRVIVKPNEFPSRVLVNEETGQVIYYTTGISFADLEKLNNNPLVISPQVNKARENHTSTVIFLHGTYGATRDFHQIEKNFPNTKFIYPHSPIIQYDMWHGAEAKPGSQEKG